MRFLSYIGILCSLAAIIASMAMNYAFMYEQGKTPLESEIYGWLSVAFDGLKSILPILIGAAFAAGKYFKGVIGSIIFTALLGFALLSAVGFAAGNRGAVVGVREAVTSQYKAATESLKVSRGLLASIKTKRASEAVSANMGALRQDKRWRSTKGCTDTTAKASIVFCKNYFAVKAEYADAKEAEKLRIEIGKLNALITDLKKQGAGKAADPQAGIIARLLPENFAIKDIQDGLVMFVALLVEMVAAFGLYLCTGLHYKTQTAPKTPKSKTEPKKPVRRKNKKKEPETIKPSEPALKVIKGTKTKQVEEPERFSLEQSRALIASK